MARDYWVRNIHDPSLTVYLPPPGKANGTAVIVVPGGGHRLLVFKAEGEEPAALLAGLGVTAFALKHRLAREEGSTYSIERDARADAYRALRLVRSRAAEWHLDPKRIGIMGFSAGGEVVGLVQLRSGRGRGRRARSDRPRERAPRLLDLHLPGSAGRARDRARARHPRRSCSPRRTTPAARTPTVRLLQQYREAKVPVEAHVFASGGHGFNMGQRSTLTSIHTWPSRLAEWLADYGWLSRSTGR